MYNYVENRWLSSFEERYGKKNTIFNTLVGSNLTYDGKYFEGGFTAVYNVFNKVLNPAERLYNRYYPRGRYFYNVGVNYKWYRGKFVFSGETAVDKQGKIATLNQLTYSPVVNTSLIVINRYYDKNTRVYMQTDLERIPEYKMKRDFLLVWKQAY